MTSDNERRLENLNDDELWLIGTFRDLNQEGQDEVTAFADSRFARARWDEAGCPGHSLDIESKSEMNEQLSLDGIRLIGVTEYKLNALSDASPFMELEIRLSIPKNRIYRNPNKWKDWWLQRATR